MYINILTIDLTETLFLCSTLQVRSIVNLCRCCENAPSRLKGTSSSLPHSLLLYKNILNICERNIRRPSLRVCSKVRKHFSPRLWRILGRKLNLGSTNSNLISEQFWELERGRGRTGRGKFGREGRRVLLLTCHKNFYKELL